MALICEIFKVPEESKHSPLAVLEFTAKQVYRGFGKTILAPAVGGASFLLIGLFHIKGIQVIPLEVVYALALNVLVTYPAILILEETFHCVLCMRLATETTPISVHELAMKYHSIPGTNLRLFVSSASVRFDGKALPSDLIKIFGSPSLLIFMSSSLLSIILLILGQTIGGGVTDRIFDYFFQLPLIVSAINLIPVRLSAMESDGMRVLRYSAIAKTSCRKVLHHLLIGCLMLIQSLMFRFARQRA